MYFKTLPKLYYIDGKKISIIFITIIGFLNIGKDLSYCR